MLEEIRAMGSKYEGPIILLYKGLNEGRGAARIS